LSKVACPSPSTSRTITHSDVIGVDLGVAKMQNTIGNLMSSHPDVVAQNGPGLYQARHLVLGTTKNIGGRLATTKIRMKRLPLQRSHD